MNIFQRWKKVINLQIQYKTKKAIAVTPKSKEKFKSRQRGGKKDYFQRSKNKRINKQRAHFSTTIMATK
jgi:hypothetical protein